LKRGIDLNIIKAKEGTKTRSDSASNGEEEDEKIIINKGKDKTLLRDLGGDLDVMHNFLPNVERRELNKRAFGKEYLSSELFNFEILKKNKNSPADKRGFKLQLDARMIANQAVQIQACCVSR
jgi:hypothetical protein